MESKVELHFVEAIKPPPTVTLPLHHLKSAEKDSIVRCIQTTKHLKEKLFKLSAFIEVEVSTLSVFVYKNKNRFRNDKGFKDVRMVQKSWLKLQKLQLQKLVENFYESLPIIYDVNSGAKSCAIYVPTRQMLQFLLVRLRGSFHLLHKVQVLGENAGDLALKRIHLGHFWNIGLMHLALVSRLWTLGQALLSLISQSYSSLQTVLTYLPSASGHWIAKDYVFPLDLFEDLSPNEEELLRKRLEHVTTSIMPEFVVKSQKENEEFCGKLSSTRVNTIDLGEVIERTPSDTKPSVGSKPSPDLPCTAKFYKRLAVEVSKLTSAEKISNFLACETKSRKVDRKSALTKKLDQASWRELREEMRNRLESDSKNEKKFLKSLRQTMTWWILFPVLKGEKPEQWGLILAQLSK